MSVKSELGEIFAANGQTNGIYFKDAVDDCLVVVVLVAKTGANPVDVKLQHSMDRKTWFDATGTGQLTNPGDYVVLNPGRPTFPEVRVDFTNGAGVTSTELNIFYGAKDKW